MHDRSRRARERFLCLSWKGGNVRACPSRSSLAASSLPTILTHLPGDGSPRALSVVAEDAKRYRMTCFDASVLPAPLSPLTTMLWLCASSLPECCKSEGSEKQQTTVELGGLRPYKEPPPPLTTSPFNAPSQAHCLAPSLVLTFLSLDISPWATLAILYTWGTSKASSTSSNLELSMASSKLYKVGKTRYGFTDSKT